MVGPLPIKHHSLTGRITSDLLVQAFVSVARNKGAAGVDGVSVELFRSNALDNLRSLKNELKQGTFLPMPARSRPHSQRRRQVQAPGHSYRA